MAIPSKPNASSMVFSRPIRSETQPKNGRVRPLVNRSKVRASGSAAIPYTVTEVMPKSLAKAPICEITISPDVDISVNITNISQKTVDRSIADGPTPAASFNLPARPVAPLSRMMSHTITSSLSITGAGCAVAGRLAAWGVSWSEGPYTTCTPPELSMTLSESCAPAD
jgi:hypothetical protein